MMQTLMNVFQNCFLVQDQEEIECQVFPRVQLPQPQSVSAVLLFSLGVLEEETFSRVGFFCVYVCNPFDC